MRCSPRNTRRICRNYCRPRRKSMWFKVRRWRAPTRIMINCCTFTHLERRVCRRQPSSRIRDTFSSRLASTIWPISNRRTSSTRHCRCITRPAAWWVWVKRFSSAPRWSFARSSLHLATSRTARNTSALWLSTLAKCADTFWPHRRTQPTPITVCASSSATDFVHKFGHNLSIASKSAVLPNSMVQLKAMPISVSDRRSFRRWHAFNQPICFHFAVNINNVVGAIGFVSRIIPSVYPISIIKADAATGEPIRDANGLCQVRMLCLVLDHESVLTCAFLSVVQTKWTGCLRWKNYAK